MRPLALLFFAAALAKRTPAPFDLQLAEYELRVYEALAAEYSAEAAETYKEAGGLRGPLLNAARREERFVHEMDRDAARKQGEILRYNKTTRG